MNFDYGAALKMPRIRAPRRKKTCGAGLKKKRRRRFLEKRWDPVPIWLRKLLRKFRLLIDAVLRLNRYARS
ncbi:hypothetical protein RAH42_04405 [Pyramidobacter sp. YE332]|uniref:hypothetical protein n=1 Tax=Pyramidobacter sp. YE332 TaxID=3068894 RepID=UPI00294AAB33|nr:hypothetical protein [Pyramidobacter sp. YE332]WOL40884.1 hypothetical protein RAH42_04405 [Pyramidobacter sp. YE332]